MADGLPYNGWSALIRHGRDKHYYWAQKKGVLPPAVECLGCKTRFGQSTVSYHAEEYGPTHEDYWASCVPLCHRCHAMLHARFHTPNRWRMYLAQAADGNINETDYPQSKHMVAHLSRFKKKREDIPCFRMPENVPEYFRALPMKEYAGAHKVATLLVADLNTGRKLEVPDWTLYGEALNLLGDAERRSLESRGVDVAGFLARTIKLPLGRTGAPIYRRLYV